MKTTLPKLSRLIALGAVPAVLIACGGGSSNPTTLQFRVDIVNLTAGQPFSPMAVVTHQSGYRFFTVGEAASQGLEILAEGGDNSTLISEATADALVQETQSGSSPVGPGGSDSFTVTINESDASTLYLSTVSMLVNTNDAITAASSISLAGMEVDGFKTVNTIAYDSGTEANSELAGTIPGPADGGEGFNATRDDTTDAVLGHSGVVTSDDGLANSVLTQAHRWDNPVARVTVTRVQ